MVSTIQPREYFPIARAIQDPSDATVYYIRAVIRNARTGATIDTVNLTSLGSGLWAYSWQVVADPSGQGLFITITTRVYTDSGYTLLSDMYGQEQDTFLIYDRMKWVAGMAQQISAIGMSPDIDYAKIKKMVDSAVSKQLEPLKTAIADIAEDVDAIEVAEQVETDLGPILEGLDALHAALEPMTKLQNTDLSGVLAMVTEARNTIKNFKVDPPEPTDLGPVLDAIKKKEVTQVDHPAIIEGLMPALEAKLKEILTPEFMDAFIKQGMSSSMLADFMDRSAGNGKQKPTNYKKQGGRFVRT